MYLGVSNDASYHTSTNNMIRRAKWVGLRHIRVWSNRSLIFQKISLRIRFIFKLLALRTQYNTHTHTHTVYNIYMYNNKRKTLVQLFLFTLSNNASNESRKLYYFFNVTKVPRGPGLYDHAQTHHICYDRSLKEWSARRRNLYLTIRNNQQKQISIHRRDSNPQFQQANDRRLTPHRPRGHRGCLRWQRVIYVLYILIGKNDKMRETMKIDYKLWTSFELSRKRNRNTIWTCKVTAAKN
jgi:hypothetical protein